MDGLMLLGRVLGVGLWRVSPISSHSEPTQEGSYLHLEASVLGGLAELLQSVHAEDRAGLAVAAERAAVAGKVLVFPFRTAGSPIRFLRIAATVRYAAGALVLSEGLLQDETAHINAEARLAMLADTTPALLWLMDANGFCSFFSRSWYEYTGQTPEEALGLGWLQKVHPSDIEMAADCAKRAALQGTHFRIEHRLRHRDGAWRWVLCVGNPRFSSSGEFLGHSGAVTDIHERRLWEMRVRASA